MLLVQMPVDASQLKQRIIEVLNAKAELKIRYHVIVLAEALGAICLHIAKEEFKQEPFSYSECFTFLDEKGVCGKCAKDLRSIVRLRNLLAHQYWTIDDQKVYYSIKNDFKGVDKFLESVQEKYAIDL